MIEQTRRDFIRLAAAGGAMGAMGSAAWAQAAPRLAQAKVFTGFPAGDMIDTIARTYAEKIKGHYADVTLVDNKPGAGGQIGAATVKALPADGSNILFTPAPIITLYPHVFKTLAYDPMKDLVPVARTSVAAFALTVGPAVPASVKTLGQFLDWCRANPDKANYSASAASWMRWAVRRGAFPARVGPPSCGKQTLSPAQVQDRLMRQFGTASPARSTSALTRCTGRSTRARGTRTSH